MKNKSVYKNKMLVEKIWGSIEVYRKKFSFRNDVKNDGNKKGRLWNRKNW
jgi:hypothetical protein